MIPDWSFSLNLLKLCECVIKHGKITVVTCFIKSEIWSKEKKIKNTHVEVDDRGTNWTALVDHYKL